MTPAALSRISPLLAAACGVLIVGLAIALSNFEAGPWMDEFNTIVTARGSLSDFIGHSLRGQHPLLFEGLIFIAQSAGITGIAGMRAVNLLGVPLVLAALWIAQRRGVMTTAQAAIAIALYASSTTLLLYVPSVRPYFLVFSASIAVSLAWLLLLRESGQRTNALAFWAGALAIFVNLHYFATIFGGVLTLALLIDCVRRKDTGGALRIAAVSAAAALPAIVMGLLQAGYTEHGGVLYYYTPGLEYALSTIWAALVTGASFNLVAVAWAALGLAAIARTKAWARIGGVLALTAVTTLYLLLILIADLLRPMLFDRYLAAAGGAVLIVLALLSTELLPKIAPWAIGAFALVVQINAVVTDPGWWGWAPSAVAIERVVRRCPSTHVYAVPYARVSNGDIATTPLNPTEIEARAYGYRFYADRYRFAFAELQPGAVVAAAGPCPALIWIEHFWPPDTDTASMLAKMDLSASGRASWTRIGAGVVVTVYPPRQ
jgi:hypothetical protein